MCNLLRSVRLHSVLKISPCVKKKRHPTLCMNVNDKEKLTGILGIQNQNTELLTIYLGTQITLVTMVTDNLRIRCCGI